MSEQLDIEGLTEEVEKAINQLPEDFYIPSDFDSFLLSEDDDYLDIECADDQSF